MTGGELLPKKLLAKYGDRLICVRYRYDEIKGKRYCTVELIEEEHEWTKFSTRILVNKIMNIKVGIKEANIQNLIRKAGERWNRKKNRGNLPIGM